MWGNPIFDGPQSQVRRSLSQLMTLNRSKCLLLFWFGAHVLIKRRRREFSDVPNWNSKHLVQRRRRSAWCLLTRPVRSCLIRAARLESAPMFCFNQPSSVIFGRLHSAFHPAKTKLRARAGGRPFSLGDTTPGLAVGARSWPWRGVVMRGRRIFHLSSLAAWLAANGLCPPRFNPLGLRSPITYEMTTVSHPVSHLPRFHTSLQPNHSCEINERRWGGTSTNYNTTYCIVIGGTRQCSCSFCVFLKHHLKEGFTIRYSAFEQKKKKSKKPLEKTGVKSPQRELWLFCCSCEKVEWHHSKR